MGTCFSGQVALFVISEMHSEVTASMAQAKVLCGYGIWPIF